MGYRIITGSRDDVVHQLNAEVVGVTNLGAQESWALHDLTLIFASPSVTVTFSGGVGEDPLTLAQIVEQINDEVAGIARLKIVVAGTTFPGGLPQRDIRLALELDAGFTVDKDGTANEILGLNTVADTVSTPVAAADIVAVVRENSVNGIITVLIAP